jgi:guanine deaminase
MRLDDRVGNLARGYEADIVVLDLSSQPLIAQRMAQVQDIWGALFLQMILADDRAVRATYVAGRKAYERPATTSAPRRRAAAGRRRKA